MICVEEYSSGITLQIRFKEVTMKISLGWRPPGVEGGKVRSCRRKVGYTGYAVILGSGLSLQHTCKIVMVSKF